MRSFITSSIFAMSNTIPSASSVPTPSSVNTLLSGLISINLNRLLSAVSISAIERSAVFMVPSIYTLFGTEKGSPEYGRTASIASFAPARFVSSISVINSPNIFEIFPRLISSIINTQGLVSCSTFTERPA